jgi:autotransporter-associated beta strand protein
LNKAFGIGVGGVVLLSRAFTPAAMAACSNTAPPSNTTVGCSGTSIPAVTAQAGSTGVAINVDATASGSFVHATNPVAFSVDTSSTITSSGNLSLTGGGGSGTARGAVLLGINNNSQVTNAAAGVINTTGAFNDGMAANGSGNTLTNKGSITTNGPNAYGMTAAWGQTNSGQLSNTLINTGSVSISGSNARAASILGGSGVVNNGGTLSTTGASSTTVYLQGNNDQLINSGTITASGSGSDAVFSNTAGSSFTATIQNLAGGQIISQNAAGIRTLNGNSTVINAGLVQSNAGTAISMGNGNDSLILQTGSIITGRADGGAGSNTVTLQGTGTASNVFTNFQTLLMQGTLWNWTGSGTFALAHVQTGTLNLTGTLGATASAVVDTGATLQANAQNLPQNVTDNGLVRFAQDNAGTYSGLIAGAGAVEKSGAGTLTLAPATAGGNTYAGGTNIDQGVLAAGADNALGASAGGITFNGGALHACGHAEREWRHDRHPVVRFDACAAGHRRRSAYEGWRWQPADDRHQYLQRRNDRRRRHARGRRRVNSGCGVGRWRGGDGCVRSNTQWIRHCDRRRDQQRYDQRGQRIRTVCERPDRQLHDQRQRHERRACATGG